MTEPLEQPRHPGNLVAPHDAELEDPRRNVFWGWALFGCFLLLFAGTFVVALVYNAVGS
ncbi:MAG: hypothetical protein WBB74_06415 [Gaiellaceae bacterium]